MAIDTRNKRFSIANALGIGDVMPNPDGGFASKADRQQVGGYYSGIDAAAVAVITGNWSARMSGSVQTWSK